MNRRSRRRRPQAPAIPYVIVSDDSDDENSDHDPAGPHPWPARTVAAAAAAAAAIARAVRATADAAVIVAPQADQQQQPRADDAPRTSPAALTAAATRSPAAAAPAALGAQQGASEPAEPEEVGASCTICYEPMYEEGSHRAATLRCGHIFGSNCIQKWLQQKNRCPQCNQRSKVKDITLLYNLPKLAAGAAPEDIQRQLQELEASKRQEEQRAAELERSVQELQKQLAIKEHQQLQQQQRQQQAAQIAAGTGMQPWRQQQQQYFQQQQQQQVPYSGPGRPPTGCSVQQQQQQQPYQQQRPPLQPMTSGQVNPMGQAVAAATWQQQQLAGQKRSWEQISPPGPPQLPQQQQQQTAAAASIIWPLLTLQPIKATRSDTSCFIQSRTGAAGVSAAEYASTQAPGGFAGCAASGMTATAAAGPRRKYLPGCFSTLQEFELSGSRSFYLDVPGTLALVAETPPHSGSRLRKISLVCPGQPSYTSLPANAGLVRCLASPKQLLGPYSSLDSSNINTDFVAVATDKAGLLIASLSTQNVVQSIPVSGPVWSVAWNPQNSQQLLLGLDKGRIAVADIRKSSHEALLFTSHSTSSSRPMQPLHSLLPLHPKHLAQIYGNSSSSSSSSESLIGGGNAAPEALVACAGGVYSWSGSSVDAFSLLLPSTCHGGNCESIALAADGSTVAVSFRSPLRWTPPAAAAGGGGFISSSSAAATVDGVLPKGAPMHVLCKLGMIAGPECLVLSDSSVDRGTAATAAAGGMGTQEMEVLLPTQPAFGAAVGSASAAAASQPAAVGPAAAADSRASDPAAVAAAIKAGQEQLMQHAVKLYGHSSSQTLTNGCFTPSLPGVQDEQQLFLSADEASCQPCLWGCSSGALLEQRQGWQGLPGHILQLAWGQSNSLNALLIGAMSDRRLVLYDWQPNR